MKGQSQRAIEKEEITSTEFFQGENVLGVKPYSIRKLVR